MRILGKAFRILAILLIFLILTNIIPGCNDSNNNSGEAAKSDEFFNGDVLELDEFVNTEDSDTMPATSAGLIEAALSKGEIDMETASGLLVLASYAPERLPGEYKGEEGESSQFAIRYLLANWDSLSENTRNEVEPYILPMDDPRSVFNPESKEEYAAGFDMLFMAQPVYAVSGDTIVKNEFTHDGQNFTIMYTDKASWTPAIRETIVSTATLIKETIKHAWDDYKPYMGVKPSKPYIIELLRMKNHNYGEEFTQGGKYRIRLNYYHARNISLMKSTVAHELFHSFQEEMNIGFTGTEEKWFCEATAVWAENYAFPEMNFEHIRHKGFFKSLDRDRIGFGRCFEYYSYMLFYFLTDYMKIDFIRDLTLENAKKGNSVIRTYLNDHITNIRETYGNFALYNWNRNPVEIYDDFGPITGNPSGSCIKKESMGADEEDINQVSLKPGGLKYYFYTFDGNDPGLKHVKITFDKNLEGDKYVKRQAILCIEGEWKVEDWSGIIEKTYCRNREIVNEKLDALVIIYSNGDFTESDKTNIDRFVVRTEDCNSKMEITVDATFEYAAEDFVWKSDSKFRETLEIKDHCMFLVKNANYSFTGEGEMEGSHMIDTSGSFSFSDGKTSIEKSMTRILLSPTSNVEGLGDTFKKFGISDNIASSGIFISIPAFPEDSEVKGNSTFYFPEPVGEIDMDTPLIFDGITQIGAIILDISDWNHDGIEFTREINLLNYKSPLTGLFTADFGVLSEQLKLMENVPDIGNASNISNIPSVPDVGKISGTGDIPDLGNIPGLGNTPSTGGQPKTSALSGLPKIVKIMAAPQSMPGAVATVKLHVRGRYVDD